MNHIGFYQECLPIWFREVFIQARGVPIINNILASRCSGKSTLILCLAFDYAMSRSNTKQIILGNSNQCMDHVFSYLKTMLGTSLLPIQEKWGFQFKNGSFIKVCNSQFFNTDGDIFHKIYIDEITEKLSLKFSDTPTIITTSVKNGDWFKDFFDKSISNGTGVVVRRTLKNINTDDWLCHFGYETLKTDILCEY